MNWQKAIRPFGPGTTARADEAAISVPNPRARATNKAQRRFTVSTPRLPSMVPSSLSVLSWVRQEDEARGEGNRLGDARGQSQRMKVPLGLPSGTALPVQYGRGSRGMLGLTSIEPERSGTPEPSFF